MKKHLLFLFATLLSLVASAHDFEFNGIYYNITSEADKTVEVTQDGINFSKYSGSITVPATVTHNGVQYSVTSIEKRAFSYCSSLTAITIPEGVTSIGDEAFYGCSNLTAVHISSLEVWCNIDFADSYANPLYYAKNLYLNGGLVTELTIPNSVTAIKNHAFHGCSSLTSITIPEGVTSIGNSAFFYCSSLTAITIPEGVTSIGEDAFKYCSSLKTVINYSDLPLQRGSNDYGKVALDADRVINIDEVIDGYAFKTKEGVHYLTGYIGDKTELTLPADYKGENYQIGERAFYECSSLIAITIPKGVTSIGNYAFYECSSLTAINIPESVTSIGGGAFRYCSSLTAITLPEGVTSIGDYAFQDCSSLTAINIPEGVTSIGGGAFRYCSSLTAINIPEGVTSIGYRAFDVCNNLKLVINYSDLPLQRGSSSYGYVGYYADRVINVDNFIGDYAFKTKDGVHYLTGYIGDDTELTLPADYKGENYQIGESAFNNCSSLTTITIPEGVTSIGDWAFRGCSSLTAITIPEDSKLTSIGDGAFYDCSSLTAITIPDSVTSIGDDAFEGCSSLKTVINYSDLPLQRGSNDYGYVAYYADRVINIDEVIDGYAFKTTEGVHYLTGYIGDKTELTLPADYKGENYQIGERAFYNCSSLTAITIPENSQLTSIGWSAFSGCSNLKELTLGKGLKKIGTDAFAGCTALEKVTIYATRPPSIEGTGNAFFSSATYENATLYVPQGCIDKYQVMTGWSSFYTIEEMEGGTLNYLTLRQADNGEVGIVVDLGRTYKVRITAFEGWKIHSVTFNGEEVTDQLTEEGTFTTPALQADAVLNIAYEKTEDNTMVANTTASRIKVQGHQGTLRITGTTEGEAISVYTTDGMLVAQESAEESETELTLPTGQVYIVKVADKVVKIGM